jgi:hypothetical protein
VVSSKEKLAKIALGILIACQASYAASRVYTNANWGYSVEVPPSIRYETVKPPNPNHGFRANISNDSFLWVNADSSDDESLNSASQTELGFWTQQGCRKLSARRSSLGGQEAVSMYLRCPVGLRRTGHKRVLLIVALNSPDNVSNSVYTVGITSLDNKRAQQSAAKTLEVIRGGFEFAK